METLLLPHAFDECKPSILHHSRRRLPATPNMPKPTIEFTAIEEYQSTLSPSKELQTQVLSEDPQTGDKTVLLTHAKGSRWGEPTIQHEYWEECYILEGRLYDERTSQWYGPGNYCCRPPDVKHGPFVADHEEGCREIAWVRFPRRSEEIMKVK